MGIRRKESSITARQLVQLYTAELSLGMLRGGSHVLALPPALMELRVLPRCSCLGRSQQSKHGGFSDAVGSRARVARGDAGAGALPTAVLLAGLTLSCAA